MLLEGLGYLKFEPPICQIFKTLQLRLTNARACLLIFFHFDERIKIDLTKFRQNQIVVVVVAVFKASSFSKVRHNARKAFQDCFSFKCKFCQEEINE